MTAKNLKQSASFRQQPTIHFGLRWQSAAATALLADELDRTRIQSGVALRLPPQSKPFPAFTC